MAKSFVEKKYNVQSTEFHEFDFNFTPNSSYQVYPYDVDVNKSWNDLYQLRGFRSLRRHSNLLEAFMILILTWWRFIRIFFIGFLTMRNLMSDNDELFNMVDIGES